MSEQPEEVFTKKQLMGREMTLSTGTKLFMALDPDTGDYCVCWRKQGVEVEDQTSISFSAEFMRGLAHLYLEVGRATLTIPTP